MTSKKTTHSNKTSLTLPEDVLTGVKLLAEVENRTFSNMVAVLLKEALKSRGMPLITESEWVKRNIQIKERPEAVLAQVPRFFNLQDFIGKFKALPAWDVTNEAIIEGSLKARIKERYAGNTRVQPVLQKAVFVFDEDLFWLEVPLFTKT